MTRILNVVALFWLALTATQAAGADQDLDVEEENEIKWPVVGIDLGTTYSVVACVTSGETTGRVEIISNDQGNRITPSYVAFTTTDSRLVGDAAKNQATVNPENTIFDIKRLIGRSYLDESVQHDKELVPYKIVPSDHGGTDTPLVQIQQADGKTHTYTPEEISAVILQHMKATAEAYLGVQVENAVITVPAYFNDAQRQATKNAGRIAGLNVRRIINEPTAAAIAYGMDKQGKEENILVYDLGGGTFDVTLLVIDNGIFDVLATHGDTHLGGEDFDQRVMQYFIQKIPHQNIQQDKRALQKLRKEVERVKRALSTQPQAKLEIEDLVPGYDLSETLTRAKFEELNIDLFKKTLIPVEQVLKDAQMDKEDIDEIVLVGGSTRIPKVQELLKEFFNGKAPNKGIHPDEAVAYGAGVQGGILSGTGKNQGLLLLDVTPLTLGHEFESGEMDVVIKRGSTIPTEKFTTVTTVKDGQTEMDIKIFEGERSMCKDNHFLGEFTIRGIRPARREEASVEIKFAIDANGILEVTAVDKESGNTASITISSQSGRLSENEMTRMIQEAEVHAAADRKLSAKIQAKNALESSLYHLKNMLEDHGRKIPPDDRKDLEDSIDEHLDWMEENDSADKEDFDLKYAEAEKLEVVISKHMMNYKAGDFESDDDSDEDSDDDSDDRNDEL